MSTNCFLYCAGRDTAFKIKLHFFFFLLKNMIWDFNPCFSSPAYTKKKQREKMLDALVCFFTFGVIINAWHRCSPDVGVHADGAGRGQRDAAAVGQRRGQRGHLRRQRQPAALLPGQLQSHHPGKILEVDANAGGVKEGNSRALRLSLIRSLTIFETQILFDHKNEWKMLWNSFRATTILIFGWPVWRLIDDSTSFNFHPYIQKQDFFFLNYIAENAKPCF